MSKINTGGPAFPQAKVTVLAEDGTPNEAAAVTHNGMTLRDYFAAKAMPFVAGRAELEHTGPDEWAAACYEMADAMLAARSAAVQHAEGGEVKP